MPFKKGQSGNPGGQWKPGQSGNPNGRPKSKPFLEALARVRKQMNPEDADKVHDEIAQAMIAKCLTGDMSAIKEYADRHDGKVPTPVGGTDELPAIKGISWLEPTEDEQPPATDNAQAEGDEKLH